MKKLFTLFVSLWMAIASLFAANISANTVIYFDASAYTNIQTSIASGKTLQMLLGHSSWSQGYKMTAVDGYDNIYSVKMPQWDGCTQLAFCTVDSEWGGEGSSVTSRLNWTYEKTAVHSISSNMSGNVGFAGNPLTRTNNYTLPVKAPKITVAAAPEFATTTVGETSNATLKYTLENATEATATIEGEGFSISAQAVGSVTIAFAPDAEGDYTGTLTITSGEVKETVALAAKAVAAEAPKVPEFLNVSAAEFAEIMEGETTSATVTYELLNAEEATATVEGEGFAITAQEVGSVTIEFTAEEAGVFEGTLTLTSGETVKEITFTATAKKAPVVITISFVNPGWTEAALYAWTTGDGDLTAPWPGLAMTKGENGKFTYDLTLPENGTYNFIINNNNKGVQSVNLTGVTESTCYVIETLTDGKFTVAVSETCEYQEPVKPEPIDPYVAIRGTMTDWDMANDIKMTYNAEAANGPEWYITAFEVPEEGKFKVVSVDAQSQTTWYGSDKVDLQEGITNDGKGDGDIVLPAGKYDIYFKVNEGRMWIQKYVEPTPEPEPEPVVITFVDEVTFPKTFVGETTNDIIEFTLQNAAEDAEVVVEVTGEAFSVAEVQDNIIFLAFAPEAVGEYAGVLTVTVGEVSESLEFTAVASPVEPGPEPAETITFTVKVPEGTKECWIAGTSDDEDLAWTFIQMEKAVDAAEDNIYTLTTDKLNGKEWKYSSSNEWKYSEIIDGGGNRSEAGVPYDVVTAWQALYDPDFEPIDPYYAIRGDMTGWEDYKNDIKLTEDADNDQWYIKGFEVDGTDAFKVVYVDENANVCDECWYSNIEESVSTDIYTGGNGANIILVEGKYDIYFKPGTGAMWIAKVIPDTPTDVEDATAELIYAVDGTIFAPAPFAIIDLSGKDVTNANGSLQGTYIVKTQNSTAKISVQ